VDALLAGSAVDVARRLIGATLTLDGVGGRIVETEAYRPDDAASHSFRGPTARNRSMFLAAGAVYVYRSYGLHQMLNVVCEEEGVGAAVLVRALVPEHGRDRIAARRPGVAERDWCRGPGRLAAALALGPEHDGLRVDHPPFALMPPDGAVPVAVSRRIGIARDVDRPWRFLAAGSPFVSR
jgi:DNA-3-methyladenine glycosylase